MPRSAALARFRVVVLRHWRANGRHDLPWRRTDAYGVLVSEIMLQQTQVERVIPYFERWMRAFPTTQKLARARLTNVLAHWSGLGYNRRAKMLHACARSIASDYGGEVPRDRSALLGLPGIGPYTAGAIRAFAFDERDVLVETNIRAALLHHFFPRESDVADDRLVPILERCLSDVASARDWYAALMDYGAYLKGVVPNPSRRSRHHVRQSAFSGSSREVRGAILRASVMKQSFAPLRRRFGPRFAPAYASLVRDGLLSSGK